MKEPYDYPTPLVEAICLREVLLRCGFVSSEINIKRCAHTNNKFFLKAERGDKTYLKLLGTLDLGAEEITRLWDQLKQEWSPYGKVWYEIWNYSAHRENALDILAELIDAGFDVPKTMGI